MAGTEIWRGSRIRAADSRASTASDRGSGGAERDFGYGPC